MPKQLQYGERLKGGREYAVAEIAAENEKHVKQIRSTISQQHIQKKRESSMEIDDPLPLQSESLTQIQVNGADLVYLKRRNVSRQLLPDILVR